MSVSPITEFNRLKNSHNSSTYHDLMQLWQSLPPLALSPEIFGWWKGNDFGSIHPGHDQLELIHWWGKHFGAENDVDPILCVNDQGKIFSHLEISKGKATLWDVVFQGEPTMTMVYDNQPIFDHFKKINDTLLLGIMNSRYPEVLHDGQYYFFYLERSEQPDLA